MSTEIKFGLPENESLTLCWGDGGPIMFSITPEGDVVLGEGVTWTDAAKRFWEEVDAVRALPFWISSHEEFERGWAAATRYLQGRLDHAELQRAGWEERALKAEDAYREQIVKADRLRQTLRRAVAALREGGFDYEVPLTSVIEACEDALMETASKEEA